MPAAQANGDPASDVLITQQVFLSFEAPISTSASDELKKTVAAANARGYPIRVAVIAFTGDLGTAVSPWGHPQGYAKFLGSELAFVYSNRLLIAMPAGFGFYRGRKPVAKERRVLAKLRAGKTPTALAESTAEAVRSLAAAEGITLPEISSAAPPGATARSSAASSCSSCSCSSFRRGGSGDAERSLKPRGKFTIALKRVSLRAHGSALRTEGGSHEPNTASCPRARVAWRCVPTGGIGRRRDGYRHRPGGDEPADRRLRSARAVRVPVG